MKAFMLVIAYFTVAWARNYGSIDPDVILKQASDIQPDGSYSYEYETGNGILASEQGVGGHSAQGQVQYTAPDGTPVQLSYVADENGYQPSGSHIPTPPPVPEPILRALEYIRTHPPQTVTLNELNLFKKQHHYY